MYWLKLILCVIGGYVFIAVFVKRFFDAVDPLPTEEEAKEMRELFVDTLIKDEKFMKSIRNQHPLPTDEE